MAAVTPVTRPTNRRRAFAQADTNGPIRSQHRGGAVATGLKLERMGCNVNMTALVNFYRVSFRTGTTPTIRLVILY